MRGTEMGRRRRTDERDGEFGWCACVLVCERSSNLKGDRWDGTRREFQKLKMGWRRGDGAAPFRFSKILRPFGRVPHGGSFRFAFSSWRSIICTEIEGQMVMMGLTRGGLDELGLAYCVQGSILWARLLVATWMNSSVFCRKMD
jgi:hypothetical protein